MEDGKCRLDKECIIRHYARTAPEAILELAAKVDKLREPRAVYRTLL